MGIESITRAILDDDALLARSLVQDWFAAGPRMAAEPEPLSRDARLLAIAASLAELFAERFGQTPPGWAKDIGPLDEPIYLLGAARTMTRLRRLCEEQSPEPLRRRRLFAPKDYLTLA